MSLDCECYVNYAGEKVICAGCQLQESYVRKAIEWQKDADEIIKEAYRIIKEAEHGTT